MAAGGAAASVWYRVVPERRLAELVGTLVLGLPVDAPDDMADAVVAVARGTLRLIGCGVAPGVAYERTVRQLLPDWSRACDEQDERSVPGAVGPGSGPRFRMRCGAMPARSGSGHQHVAVIEVLSSGTTGGRAIGSRSGCGSWRTRRE